MAQQPARNQDPGARVVGGLKEWGCSQRREASEESVNPETGI